MDGLASKGSGVDDRHEELSIKFEQSPISECLTWMTRSALSTPGVGVQTYVNNEVMSSPKTKHDSSGALTDVVSAGPTANVRHWNTSEDTTIGFLFAWEDGGRLTPDTDPCQSGNNVEPPVGPPQAMYTRIYLDPRVGGRVIAGRMRKQKLTGTKSAVITYLKLEGSSDGKLSPQVTSAK